MMKKLFSRMGVGWAIGASLMVIAGAVQAAGAGAPVARATNPNLVDVVNLGTADADIRALMSAGGTGNMVQFDVVLTATADTANTTQIEFAAGNTNGTAGSAGPTILTAPQILALVTVAAGTTTLTPTAATFTSRGQAAANAAPFADLEIALPAQAAPAAYRIANASGHLQFTADNTVASPTWTDITVAIIANNTTASLFTDVGGGTANQIDAGDVLNGAIAAAAIGDSLAPTPIVSTLSIASGAGSGALVNAFTIDTATPINLAASNLAVKTTGNGQQTFPAAAMNSPVCAAGLSTCVVQFPNLGVVATAADFVAPVGTPDAADAAFYNSTNFNTGVQAGTVPFSVDGVNSAKAAYAQVFNISDGAASKLANFGGAAAGDAAVFPNPVGTIADGAQAIVVSVQSSNAAGTTETLVVTFSEPVALLGGDDLREITENILVGGTDSLAALNLNAGGSLALVGPTVVNGQGVLSITGVQQSDVNGKTVNVNQGIALKEVNDAGFSATTPALDTSGSIGPDGVQLAGGLAAVNGTTPSLQAPSATGLTISAAPLVIAFGGPDTSAIAFTAPTDATKVDTVVVSFVSGKEVQLGGTNTLATLANDLVITVNGLQGNNPVQFQFHPAATAVTIAGTPAGSQLKIVLNTALIYSQVSTLTSMAVEYLPAGVNNTVLVGVAAPNPTVQQAAAGASLNLDGSNPGTPGTEPVVLPLSATPATDTLITQSVSGTVAGGSANTSGSRVTAYLAVYLDGPTSILGQNVPTVNSVSIQSGNVTNSGDKVGTNLAIEFLDKANLQNLIMNQLNAVAPAQPAVPGVSNAVSANAAKLITVYVKLIRSNDPTANASGASTDGQVYLNGRALMATNYNTAKGAPGSGDGLDPIYEVQLNPTTGAVTGRLTGSVVIWVNRFNFLRGLFFVGPDGTVGPPTPVGQAIVGANGYNLVLGIDPHDASVPAPCFGTTSGTNSTPCPTPRFDFFGTNFNAIKSAGVFVLLVHEQPGAANPFTMLTSADPSAANFLPFTPNLLTGSGTRTTLASDLTKIVKMSVVPSMSWALYGEGNPARQTPPAGNAWSFPRGLVGLTPGGPAGATPKSFWAGDGNFTDLAMTITNNSITVATEQSQTGGTLSTINANFGVAGAVAFAWANDSAGLAGEHIDVLQSSTAVSSKVGSGWSLVTVPAAGLNTANIDAIILVGAQLDASGRPQVTWIKATDGAAPTLVPGEAVFVFSKSGGTF